VSERSVESDKVSLTQGRGEILVRYRHSDRVYSDTECWTLVENKILRRSVKNSFSWERQTVQTYFILEIWECILFFSEITNPIDFKIFSEYYWFKLMES